MGKLRVRAGVMGATVLFVMVLGGMPAHGVEPLREGKANSVGAANLPTCYVDAFVDKVDRRAEVYGSGVSTCEATMTGALSMTFKRDGVSLGSDVCEFNAEQACTVGITVENRAGTQLYRACVTVQGSIRVGNQPVIPVNKSECYSRSY